MKKDPSHWAYRELEKRLARAEGAGSINNSLEPEIGTMFLADPEMSGSTDEIIVGHLWPAVAKGLQGSAIQIHDREDVLSRIGTKRSPVLTRELIFLLEMPNRPVALDQRPLWYVRFTIEASVFRYMLKSDLILELPKGFELLRLLVLMEHPRLSGFPPSLSIDGESYVVTFSWGRGGSYQDEEFVADRFITRKIREHLRIIEATDQLERDIENDDVFQVLGNRILDSYGDREVYGQSTK